LRDRRRRREPATRGRPLGCGRAGRLGVGVHDPGCGNRRRALVRRSQGVLMDRRALFFLGASVVCALLILPTPTKYRWFAILLAVVYSVLAFAAWLDNRSRNRYTIAENHRNRSMMSSSLRGSV